MINEYGNYICITGHCEVPEQAFVEAIEVCYENYLITCEQLGLKDVTYPTFNFVPSDGKTIKYWCEEEGEWKEYTEPHKLAIYWKGDDGKN